MTLGPVCLIAGLTPGAEVEVTRRNRRLLADGVEEVAVSYKVQIAARRITNWVGGSISVPPENTPQFCAAYSAAFAQQSLSKLAPCA